MPMPTFPLARLGAFRNELHVGVAGGTASGRSSRTLRGHADPTHIGARSRTSEVVELYRSGLITPDVERFTMDDALEAYRRLRDGELDARAVVGPHS